MNNEIQPSLRKGAFRCARCGTQAPHKHFEIMPSIVNPRDIDIPSINLQVETFDMGKGTPIDSKAGGLPGQWELYISVCSYCREYTIWENGRIIFPEKIETPEPSDDMPKEVKDIYNEARLVYNDSPRSSAALLRLAIETLVPRLDFGIEKDKLNNMIAKLVEENIPHHIQQGLDAIRYYGNNGIHAAEIDMQDDRDSVIFLFELCNMIVEELISKAKRANEFYDLMPERFRLAVSKRDNK